MLCDWKLVKIASRQSFLVNPEGEIVKHYTEVGPETYTKQVIEDLKYLMAEPSWPFPHPGRKEKNHE